jgi:hypothetical protein
VRARSTIWPGLQGRGFADTVSSQQCNDFAFAYPEIDIVKDSARIVAGAPRYQSYDFLRQLAFFRAMAALCHWRSMPAFFVVTPQSSIPALS